MQDVCKVMLLSWTTILSAVLFYPSGELIAPQSDWPIITILLGGSITIFMFHV